VKIGAVRGGTRCRKGNGVNVRPGPVIVRAQPRFGCRRRRRPWTAEAVERVRTMVAPGAARTAVCIYSLLTEEVRARGRKRAGSKQPGSLLRVSVRFAQEGDKVNRHPVALDALFGGPDQPPPTSCQSFPGSSRKQLRASAR
jgi:hypothetical protein